MVACPLNVYWADEYFLSWSLVRMRTARHDGGGGGVGDGDSGASHACVRCCWLQEPMGQNVHILEKRTENYQIKQQAEQVEIWGKGPHLGIETEMTGPQSAGRQPERER